MLPVGRDAVRNFVSSRRHQRRGSNRNSRAIEQQLSPAQFVATPFGCSGNTPRTLYRSGSSALPSSHFVPPAEPLSATCVPPNPAERVGRQDRPPPSAPAATIRARAVADTPCSPLSSRVCEGKSSMAYWNLLTCSRTAASTVLIPAGPVQNRSSGRGRQRDCGTGPHVKRRSPKHTSVISWVVRPFGRSRRQIDMVKPVCMTKFMRSYIRDVAHRERRQYLEFPAIP